MQHCTADVISDLTEVIGDFERAGGIQFQAIVGDDVIWLDVLKHNNVRWVWVGGGNLVLKSVEVRDWGD